MTNFNFGVIILLLFIHWVSDFLLQNDWQANNKSKNWKALLVHTTVYSVSMGLFIGLFTLFGTFTQLYWYSLLLFVFVMFICHTMIDFITSRVTTKFWKEKKIRPFFNTIGFDQYLHYFTIFLTFGLLYHIN